MLRKFGPWVATFEDVGAAAVGVVEWRNLSAFGGRRRAANSDGENAPRKKGAELKTIGISSRKTRSQQVVPFIKFYDVSTPESVRGDRNLKPRFEAFKE